MKKFIFVALTFLASNTYSAGFESLLAAGLGYVTPTTTVSLAINVKKGDTVSFGTYNTNNVIVFCSVTAVSELKFLDIGYSTLTFTAPQDDFYLATCIQSSSSITSGKILAVFAEPSFFGVSLRSNDTVPDEDMNVMRHELERML